MGEPLWMKPTWLLSSQRVHLVGGLFDGSYETLPSEAASLVLRDPDAESRRRYCYKPTDEVDAEGVKIWRYSPPHQEPA